MARSFARTAAAVTALAAHALAASPADAVIRPGQPWYDTSGNRIYAGGANLYEENGTFWMIGEGKKVLGADCSECFNLYKTTDLQNWDYVGCALNNSDIVAPAPYANEPFYRMERPKIFKCPSDGTYRMWFHCDTSGFDMKSVGVLTADNVEGPYTFAAPCFRPDGQDSYDMGTFADDVSRGGDGHVYLIRSVRNSFAGISAMTVDCLNVTGIVSQGPDMEGQAIMRDTNGVLHAAGSHLTGWSANAAQFVTTSTPSLVGAQWTDNYNPSGDSTTYDSQSTFIFPFVHSDGHVTYIWMADRWNANGPGGLDNMTNIWLPLLPPANQSASGANATVGWLLQLASCSSSDDAQQFVLLPDQGVVHVASGLCIASPPDGSGDEGMLVLAECTADAQQRWYPQPTGAVTSTPDSSGDACLAINNANWDLTAGNPVMAWACGTGSPGWNARWTLPPAGTPGTWEAYSSGGPGSGLCIAVAPPGGSGGQWVLPWYDAWSPSMF